MSRVLDCVKWALKSTRKLEIASYSEARDGPRMALYVSRILHAGYLFQSGSKKIVFDPIFENPFSHNCYAFPNVDFDEAALSHFQCEAVFISHFHDDHWSLKSLNKLSKHTPIFVYSIFEELFDITRSLGFTKVVRLELNETVVVGDFRVTTRPALDIDVDSIFHIEVKGLNVLNVVDSWIDNETLDLLAETLWDLILWPFQTMRELEVLSPSRYIGRPAEIPSEAIEQLRRLNPSYLIPSSCKFIKDSWSWYNTAF